MPFPIPSLSELRKNIVALGKALFPTLNFGSPRSFHGKRATFMAGSAAHILVAVDTAQRDLMPLTASDGKPINDWGSVVGVTRKSATPAKKSASGRVRGAAAATATSGLLLVHDATGLSFQLNQNVTIPGVFGVDPDSFVDADILAVSTGSQTRLNAGEVLRFLAPPAGIQASVFLQKNLDEGGDDAEQFGAYRARVLATFSETPSGGNQGDFARWAVESVPAITSAFAYPLRAGVGTIDIAAFYSGTGTSRVITAPDAATMLAYIRTKAPFQVSGAALRALTTIPDPQRVEITLQTNGITAFDFDWDDSPGYTVLSWTAATRELRFAGGALPASLKAGDHLTFDGTAGGSGINAQDGLEFQIESISGVDKLILAKVPTVAPAATDKVYSGGPLVTPVRDAVVGHLNGEIIYAGRGLTPIPASKASPINPTGQSVIGLDELARGIGPANPAGFYGSWVGGILLGTLMKIVTYKAGVRKATIISPAVDYEAVNDAFPLDGQIHFVTPGAIIIRKAP